MHARLVYVYFEENILTSMIDSPTVKHELLCLKGKSLIYVINNFFMEKEKCKDSIEKQKYDTVLCG